MGRPDISVAIGSLKLKNPLLASSGTFGYGNEYRGYAESGVFGAVVLKGITLSPREGNPPPRIYETSCGLLNSIGLENCGIHAFIREKLPALNASGAAVVANLSGSTGEAAEMLRMLDGTAVSGCEINLSCPNLDGTLVSSCPRLAGDFIGAVRNAYSGPLWAKLTPLASDIASVARACEDAGADAVSLVNTFPAMAIDIERMRPVLGNSAGGLSGPAIKPAALKLVWDACRAVRIPVIGMGGIMDASDAIEFILAGAHAVSVGTALFVSPEAPSEIIRGLEEYLERKGLSNLADIRGAACAR